MPAIDEEIEERKIALMKPENARSIREKSLVRNFELVDGMLLKVMKDRVNAEKQELIKTWKAFVVPRVLRKYVVVECHDRMGHFGLRETWETMRRYYRFEGMKDYLKYHLRACLNCMFNGNLSGRKEGLCNPIRPERRPFQEVFMDHMEPLPASRGKQHVIVMIDGLTEFVVLEAVKTTETRYVITHHVPRDNVSELWGSRAIGIR
ncbi:uncharacterized protein LOC108865064 [Galendromus occidentalis]|uniref:Uncharacterized protein LOC108865064 n=1 Tax=Galendromus occidentalis TaxID=34638 RepID=A0AAJ7L7X4_9ACAR|nr:uncharacterized protein LOC108865064 [Galendromus occidentalis]